MAATHEYAVHELLAMDEAEARGTLTVDQFERWEQLTALHAEADDTRQEWADQDQAVSEIVVHADKEQLGTRVDLYGNDVLVHVDPEAPAYREPAEALEAEFGDIDAEDLEDLDEADAERVVELFIDLLDAAIVEWNGTPWADLSPADREYVHQQWREAWGREAIIMAKVDVVAAVEEDRNERLDVIEKFRSPEWRGRR